MSKSIAFTEARKEEFPLCPYCKKELREILYKEKGIVMISRVVFCPHCKALLGFGSENLF